MSLRASNKYLHLSLIFLSILTGALFLYSAYTKIDPIQPFEYTLVEYLHLPWTLAALSARLIIGIEAALGVLMVLHLFGRNKWVLKFAFALTIAFSIYLITLWITVGNDVNCGCFGDAIWMSPSTSLIKNSGLLLVLAVLIRLHEGLKLKKASIIATCMVIAALTLPFILSPLAAAKPTWLRNDRYKIGLQDIYHDMNLGVPPADFTDTIAARPDLAKGKHILAFLSSTCQHCRIAAYKMHIMKEKNPALPFLLIIGGTKSDLTDFWKGTKAQNVPFTRLNSESFMQHTGGRFPLIIWINDGWVEAKADYNTLNQGAIENWLSN
ncbi:MAG: MauE/DoxX family redox-associated membrane protein [Bacteroidota bacterium]